MLVSNTDPEIWHDIGPRFLKVGAQYTSVHGVHRCKYAHRMAIVYKSYTGSAYGCKWVYMSVHGCTWVYMAGRTALRC